MIESKPPTDNGKPIPGIEEWARPVVVLNPVPGSPTAADSHIGGPMLWPADEPWPWCEGGSHESSENVPGTAAMVRVPWVGAVQLYRRDFPELPFPEGTDLLQVFLCTVVHAEVNGPGVLLHWRSSAEVGDLIGEVPVPVVSDPEFSFQRRVFAPVRTIEYPAPDDLPAELAGTFSFLQEPGSHYSDYDEWPDVARGSKIGGWTAWYHTQWPEQECSECGAPWRQTLGLATEEQEPGEPAGWLLGDDGVLNVFLCSQDARHPITVIVD
ncbi:hypothetical protein [Lentzea flaviverrucosa]|uniref:DUF1963 domain-containing protein n=1 Tax=Lentzea flaviverrucosa TaxID=200379 RepID=A0A1H9FTC1_9PSEU|nr:hypothetical protein [Lentzea flaviverrucosa]RDI35113.1 hypothetical protein DFR72_101863 [Lentzea flaviverrucosa]SEQ40999.1 hypothetical protein SAMN05216195_102354 [Lentzea flaviverrucosa]